MDKWEYLQQIDDKVAEITKDVDTEKMWEEICQKNGITREQWDKMEEWEKLSLVCPNGIWHEEEQEEDPMDEADRRYDEWQDEQAGR